jgi:hypothetical protein
MKKELLTFVDHFVSFHEGIVNYAGEPKQICGIQVL